MKKLSLRWQMIFVTSLTLILLVFFVSSIMISNFRDFYIDSLFQKMNENLNVAQANLIKDPDFTLNQENLISYVQSLATQINARATYIDLDGVVLADSEVIDVSTMDNHLTREEISLALQKSSGKTQRYSDTLNTNMLYSAILISDGFGQAGGILRLAIPASDIELLLRKQVLRIGEITLVAILLIVILTWVMISRFIKPLESLHHAFTRLADGQFGILMNIKPSNIETADLLHSFNKMSEELQRNMTEIQKQQVELQTILNSMNNGFIFIDQNGTIQMMNPAARHLLSQNSQNVNMPYYHIIRNLNLNETIESTLNEQAFNACEIILDTQNGKAYIQTTMTPLYADELKRQYRGLIIIFHDISTIRNLENNRRDLIANVSHELRTPITAIAGFTETILSMEENDPQIPDFLSIISQETSRLKKLIEDLLDLSKLEFGQLNLELTSIDVVRIIGDILAKATLDIKEGQITIINHIKNAPSIKADYFRMEQVLQNVISNAIKYTPAGGTITLSSSIVDADLKIIIEDNGSGIPPDQLGRVTERFYRVDSGRTHQVVGGSGLGLAIVKHLVRAQNGQLTIESQYGVGTTVSIRFPLY